MGDGVPGVTDAPWETEYEVLLMHHGRRSTRCLDGGPLHGNEINNYNQLLLNDIKLSVMSGG